jgi:hypothetical protein
VIEYWKDCPFNCIEPEGTSPARNIRREEEVDRLHQCWLHRHAHYCLDSVPARAEEVGKTSAIARVNSSLHQRACKYEAQNTCNNRHYKMTSAQSGRNDCCSSTHELCNPIVDRRMRAGFFARWEVTPGGTTSNRSLQGQLFKPVVPTQSALEGTPLNRSGTSWKYKC